MFQKFFYNNWEIEEEKPRHFKESLVSLKRSCYGRKWKFKLTCFPFSRSILYLVSMERRVSRNAFRCAQSVKYLVYKLTKLMHEYISIFAVNWRREKWLKKKNFHQFLLSSATWFIFNWTSSRRCLKFNIEM